MNFQKKLEINVVLFKRDLRLQDNEAIHNALKSGRRTLFLYVFEDILYATTGTSRPATN